jgi:outer membrane protein assembly factor BamB
MTGVALGVAFWILLGRNDSNNAISSPVRVAWLFEAAPPGAVISSPRVEGNRIFIGAVEDDSPPRGALYCLDADKGRAVWKFDDAGQMQHMYSSPRVAAGRVYIGDGMHANPRSKLYCLDAASGALQWRFVANGHIESTPTVEDGRVYFGAGDDGVYCLDAQTGDELWHWAGQHHVDATLAVDQGRVYGGSGLSRLRQTLEAFCLDARTGDVLWRKPLDLPAWGSARVDRGQVFIGLGNGRLVRSVEPPQQPAGALVCLDCENGRQLWRFDVPDAVLVRPAIDEERVYFGARDTFCYCLNRQDGKLLWKQSLDSPIVAGITAHGGSVYAAGNQGRVCRLDAAGGKIEWSFDVAAASGMQPRLFSTPAVLIRPDGRADVVFGAELRGWSGSAAVVYCLSEVARP